MISSIYNKNDLQRVKQKIDRILETSNNVYLTIIDKNSNIDKIEYSLKNYSIREGITVYTSIILIIDENIKIESKKVFKELNKFPTTYIYKNKRIDLKVNGLIATID